MKHPLRWSLLLGLVALLAYEYLDGSGAFGLILMLVVSAIFFSLLNRRADN
jgi:hypothetical protein